MKAKSRGNLQRTMIIYLLLVGFASVLVGLEFIAETDGQELKDSLIESFSRYAKHEIDADQALAPIRQLRNKAILMIAIILFVMIIVLTMFIKNITEPLQHMIEASRDISRGDLSRTIRIHSRNELAELGNVINETASNLQEIILLSKTIAESGKELVEKTAHIVDGEMHTDEDMRIVRQEIKRFDKDLEMLNEVIDYFNFYTFEQERND